jgi:hypothetical protein
VVAIAAITASVIVAGYLKHILLESTHLYCIFDDLKGRHGSDLHRLSYKRCFVHIYLAEYYVRLAVFCSNDTAKNALLMILVRLNI